MDVKHHRVYLCEAQLKLASKSAQMTFRKLSWTLQTPSSKTLATPDAADSAHRAMLIFDGSKIEGERFINLSGERSEGGKSAESDSDFGWPSCC